MGFTAKFTKGSIPKHIFSQASFMVVGIISVYAFNVVDTYFIGQLGSNELAAITFTFPVVSFLSALTLGLGMGVTSVIANAYGQGNKKEVSKLATDALSLSAIIVGLFVLVGTLTIEPLFRLLGASHDLIVDIKSYMKIWYYGMPFLVIPMTGNSIIRGSGNFSFPMIIMIFAGLSNIVFDYLLIFGNLGFPELGIEGAAYATTISRCLTFIASLYLLGIKKKLLINPFRYLEVLNSWKHILKVSLPSGVMNIINPVALAVVTSLVAPYGKDVVAGFGAGMRLESFFIVPMFSIGSAINPIIAQNWGIGAIDRVKQTMSTAIIFSMIWGSCVFIAMFFFAPHFVSLFSDRGEVIAAGVDFLKISPQGMLVEGIVMYVAVYFIAIGTSLRSFFVSLFRFGLFYLPLAWIGERYFGYKGIYWARVLSGYLSAIQCWCWLRAHYKKMENK